MKFLLLTFLFSCAGSGDVVNQRTVLTPGEKKFILSDSSGKYHVKRQVKISGRKLLTKTVLSNWNSPSEALEKSITSSVIGSLRTGEPSLLPFASQFSVWFDKKQYFSQLKINRKSKSISIIQKSPEAKWNGKDSKKIPAGKYYCFFSSLPECVISQNLLVLSRESKVPIYLIWDNYPYYTEQYQAMSGDIVSLVQFSFANMVDQSLRFELDIGNQIIFYHFDKELKFEKMFWVSQGISLERVN